MTRPPTSWERVNPGDRDHMPPGQRMLHVLTDRGQAALAAGVKPRTIMDVLGHSAIGVTMNTYAHVVTELREEAADAIHGLLGE
jgi:integrase